MPYLYNLDSESGGNVIGPSGSGTAVLTLSHFGTGQVLNIVSAATTAVDATVLTTSANTIAPVARFRSAASLGVALFLGKTVASSPTVPLVFFGALSAASAPVLEFDRSSFVSVTSIVLTTVANSVAAVRVKYGSSYGWIPIWADAAIIGAGAF